MLPSYHPYCVLLNALWVLYLPWLHLPWLHLP